MAFPVVSGTCIHEGKPYLRKLKQRRYWAPWTFLCDSFLALFTAAPTFPFTFLFLMESLLVALHVLCLSDSVSMFRTGTLSLVPPLVLFPFYCSFLSRAPCPSMQISCCLCLTFCKSGRMVFELGEGDPWNSVNSSGPYSLQVHLL